MVVNQKRRSILYLYISLTVLEAACAGIPLFHARSLETGEFSSPRLLLLLVWLIALAAILFFSFAAARNSALAQKTEKYIQAHSRDIFEWLLVIGTICLGTVGLYFFRIDFFSFMSGALPVLLDQYIAIIAILGVWSLQTLILMRLFFPLQSYAVNPIAPKGVLVFIVSFFLYTHTAVALQISPVSKMAYFPELADSFLQGRLHLMDPPATKDLTLFNGRYYVAFPPLGALLMMPLIALRGSAGFNIVLFNGFFSSLGVLFTFLLLESMRMRGLSRLSWWEHIVLALFLGFGTAQYFMTLRGLVNFTSQILTTTFLVISLWGVVRFQGRMRVSALIAGCMLGAAMLSRPTILPAWFALAALQMQFIRDEPADKPAHILEWVGLSLVPVALSIAFLLWYNQIRFASPFDFGYANMLVSPVLANDLAQFGQFHPYFIIGNLRDNFFRLPYWSETCGVFTFPPQGTSLFFASPVLLYLFLAFKRSIWTVGAWLSIAALVVLHALYYNSGSLQVGYRFSLDFMPIAIMLLAFGFKEKIPKAALLLAGFSVFVNYIGVLWITHRWCANF